LLVRYFDDMVAVPLPRVRCFRGDSGRFSQPLTMIARDL